MSLVERFLRYSAISSQSDASVNTLPTSEGQMVLARLLAQELEELGAVDIHLSDEACLTARIPPTKPGPSVGFVAHLDTADVNLSPDVHARVVRYDGGVLEIGKGHSLDPDRFPPLRDYVGEDVIVGDGTSVLGADDKAAIASIMTALERIQGTDHPEIFVAFVPDEEIGLRGAKALDLDRFRPDAAYTIDCEGRGSVATETFNAGYAQVEIEGVTAHPMSAKNILVNPNLVVADLMACFDRDETPEMTEGREGYIWVQQVNGNQARARVLLNIRDHDRTKYEQKKAFIQSSVDKVQAEHPRARVRLEIHDVYGNIADCITPDKQWVIDKLYDAIRSVGLEPSELIMRGGTDGSYLSTKGILTPNIFTGAFNFHSPTEILPVRSCEESCGVVTALMS